MSATYRIRHVTTSHYSAPMRFARCNVRLKPIAWDGQTLIDHRLIVTPQASVDTLRARHSLVNISRVVVSETTRTLEIVSEATVRVDRAVPDVRNSDLSIAAVAAAAAATRDVSDASPANFLYPSPFAPANRDIAAWAAAMLTPGDAALASALAMTRTFAREFRFDPMVTDTHTLPAAAFAARAGVCQDFAQIMITALRSAGLPAAYASGYIRTIPPPGRERLVGADAMHGWVLLWCGDPATPGGRGWIGFDPTNGIMMAQDHVIVAIGRDYLDIAPIDGRVTGSGAQSVSVGVDMVPLGASAP